MRRAEAAAVAEGAQRMLVDFVRERAGVRGDGQTNGGGSNVEINQRRAALSVLMSRMDRAALEAALPARGGKLLRTLRDDLAWLERAERQPLSTRERFDVSWAANGTSTPAVLRDLALRRASAAAAAARSIAADPRRAYDAGDDNLAAHLELDDPQLRAQMLGDAVVQFRARRRSTAMMDQAEPGARDASVGRIASSGPLAALEQRLACQSLQTGASLDARREYALLRLAVTSHPLGSTNGIFRARNAVALLASDRYLGLQLRNRPVGQEEGLRVSLYNAIHKEYSANTPRVVQAFLSRKVYTAGDQASRIAVLTALVEAAAARTLPEAQRRLLHLRAVHGTVIPGAEAAADQPALSALVLRHLQEHTALPALRKVAPRDRLFAYQTLVSLGAAMSVERPSDASLERDLFYAGRAWPEVAALIHALRQGSHAQAVDACGRARVALRSAFERAASGFDRQMLWRLDRQVELLSAELLGLSAAHAKAAGAELPLVEWTASLLAALRGTLASGLDAVRSRRRTSPSRELGALTAELEALVAKGTVSAEALRGLSTEIYRAATEAADSLRGYFRARELAVHFSGVDCQLDPDLVDGVVKESALHNLLELAQAGMTLGRELELSPAGVQAIPGMRVLSSIGPAVYRRVLVARNLEKLLRLGPTADDLCVVHSIDEKSMVAMGGLVTDAKEAPGGYSHLSVFAKGHGISALALPELRRHLRSLFGGPGKGGLYVDDRPQSFAVMTLAQAIAAGKVDPARVDALRPGFNYQHRYLDHHGLEAKVVEAHEVLRSAERESRTVELYLPELVAQDGLQGALPLSQLRAMPFARTRHLAGEKGAVLAHLGGLESLRALGVEVPGGATVPPYRIAELLRAAQHRGMSVWDRWMGLYAHDPLVGQLHPSNLSKSRLYADRRYRLRKAAELRQAVEQGLGALLLQGGRPTAAGRALLAELERSPDLKASGRWIARSSFTGEDRPNKSGAGQYQSYPDLRSAAARLRGLIGVIASAWGDTPVENNVQLEVNLMHVFPSVLVQPCLQPTVSGVAVSRGTRGELGQVAYQAVRGFGGGVAGGRTEEGVLARGGSAPAKGSLLTAAQAETLRQAVLAIEQAFQHTVEPGKGYAVDVEWAISGGKLHIVQARVLSGA